MQSLKKGLAILHIIIVNDRIFFRTPSYSFLMSNNFSYLHIQYNLVMNTLNIQTDKSVQQVFQGMVGFLKVTNPSSKLVKACTGLILNHRTILTLAQNVYQNQTSSFFPQIQFRILNQDHVYHVSEAFLMNIKCSQEQLGDIIEYAILKLDREIEGDSTINNIVRQHWDQKKIIQISQMQQKCLLLEGQLKEANLHIQNLTKKTKQMRVKLQQLGNSLLQLESFQNADQALSTCLGLQEYLYGEDSLKTLETLQKLALVNESLSFISCTNYYDKIISIWEKHGILEDQSYANAHFRLGCSYSKYRCQDQAIYYLETALHIYGQIDQEKQRDCARELVKVLITQASKKIRQKYDL